MHITNVSRWLPIRWLHVAHHYQTSSVDLGMMREPRYRFTGEHASKYLETMRPSQPEDGFDDRNAIYAM